MFLLYITANKLGRGVNIFGPFDTYEDANEFSMNEINSMKEFDIEIWAGDKNHVFTEYTGKIVPVEAIPNKAIYQGL